ncbi:MAG: phosphatase PAP2 family protein [Actinobacteria bacterium]|nr:phosphatase PAP2 family protein [Actinomycetota bacterium]
MSPIGALRAWNRRPLPRQARARNLEAIAAGLAMFSVASALARTREVDENEEAVFRQVNELSDHLHGPAWAVMQSGSLASVGVAASAAAMARRPSTAVGLGLGGFAVWGGAKLIKRGIKRGRPAAHIDEVNVRGREQTGLGFPSGHAAVAFTLAVVATPVLPRPMKGAAWVAATTTALSRLYVGAHLPLDVVGGVGLGVAAGSLTNLALGDRAARRW